VDCIVAVGVAATRDLRCKRGDPNDTDHHGQCR
jgi:hypothetical protein